MNANREMIKDLASGFSAAALNQIAESAERRAHILRRTYDMKRPQDVMDAIDDFAQLAAYSRRVLAWQTIDA